MRNVAHGILVLAFALVTAASAQAAAKQYVGLYRGVVMSNTDPMNLGRLIIMVPDVDRTKPLAWALPVLQAPYTVSSLKLPAVGQQVWVEFEQGDSAYPVWVGVRP